MLVNLALACVVVAVVCGKPPAVTKKAPATTKKIFFEDGMPSKGLDV